MGELAKLACPSCGQSDCVQKVSAIVSSAAIHSQGVTVEKSDYKDKDGKWYSSTEQVPFNGTQSTVLAEKLKPPAKPMIPGNPNARWTVTSFLLIMACFLLIIGACILTMGLMRPDLRANMISGILVIITGVILIFTYINLKNTREKNTASKTQTIQNSELPQWEKAMGRWELLYYCSRDDCIFTQDDKKGTSLDDMHELLFPK